jgi:hypothetical protein
MDDAPPMGATTEVDDDDRGGNDDIANTPPSNATGTATDDDGRIGDGAVESTPLSGAAETTTNNDRRQRQSHVLSDHAVSRVRRAEACLGEVRDEVVRAWGQSAASHRIARRVMMAAWILQDLVAECGDASSPNLDETSETADSESATNSLSTGESSRHASAGDNATMTHEIVRSDSGTWLSCIDVPPLPPGRLFESSDESRLSSAAPMIAGWSPLTTPLGTPNQDGR